MGRPKKPFSAEAIHFAFWLRRIHRRHPAVTTLLELRSFANQGGFHPTARRDFGGCVKAVSVLLAILLVHNSAAFAGQAAPTSGTTQVQTQETPQAAKVRTKVQKRGIGENSRVKAKLVNGDVVKGYISKIEETSFTVTDKKTGQATTVPYADVQKIQGPGLSNGNKILIGIGVGVVVFGIVVGIILSKMNS